MAVCGGCVDTGQKSPTDTGGRGTRTPNPPAPEQYAHGRWTRAMGLYQIVNDSEQNVHRIVVHMRRCGASAQKVVFLFTYLSYDNKLRG